MAGDALSQDALVTNQSGRLTDEQARVWQQIARERRKGIRGAACLAAAIGVVLLFAKGPASKAVIRNGVGVACLALAVVILVVSGRDALTADIRDGRLDTIEGAIAKHFVQVRGGTGSTTFYLDIAGHHLRTGRDAYDVAPDAGIVRAYYLPRTRRLVNLERLPDRPLPTGGAPEIVKTLTSAIRNRDPAAMAEARAAAAGLVHAITGPMPPVAADPTGSGDSRLRAEMLWGSWTNPLMTVTFTQNGAAAVTVLGGARRVGHWSIDADGRLLTDVSGAMAPTEAWVTGDRLTITVEGRTLTFTRPAAS